MTKSLHTICFLFFVVHLSYSQENFWTSLDYDELNVSNNKIINHNIIDKKASYFRLNKTALKSHLSLAPYRQESNQSNIEISLPNQNGGFEVYQMFKVKTLAQQLAQTYPDIQSYVGKRVDKTDASVLKLTINPQGIYVMIKKPDIGQFFINPYDKSGDYYVAFIKSNARQNNNFSCEINATDGLFEGINQNILSDIENEALRVDDSTLRIYNLAIACTGEYAQFHIDQAGLGEALTAEQKEAVLGAMTVTIDRVNTIYEIDLGVSFQVVADNDRIIYLNPDTDPFSNTNIFSIVDENQTVIDNEIGSSEYNIGHIFTTAGGGFAPGSVCVSGDKARAATGLSNPVGDPFDIDYVSHEIGHQFGAGHTQNNGCNRFSQTAVEPGSGSTIMGYAGICAPNVQNNSDANFHQVNIAEMYDYISVGAGAWCGNFVTQTNTAPIIAPLPNSSYTIPHGTAFYLEVEAVDEEDDPLTYSWEQIDNDVSIQPPLTTTTNGPNFRALPPSINSRRYFPKLQSVLSNNLFPTWEVIPTVSRSMNFAVIVRDNNINVGQSDTEFVQVNFADVGPFQVSSQNTSNVNWINGEIETITWDNAGTTGNGINTSLVDILLSTDGGETFDTVLASNTPNDGSEDITVPDLQSSTCRIIIKPVNNIYYALNLEPFSISNDSSEICNQYSDNNSAIIPDGLGTTQNPEQGEIFSNTINISENITNISGINISLNVSHTFISDLGFQLQAPNGETVFLWDRNCSDEDNINITFNDNGLELPEIGLDCSDPLTGTYAPVDSDNGLTTIFSSGTAGDWTLICFDLISGNVGALNSWGIEICSTNFSVQNNEFNDFSIIPNPNNGIFELNFNQPLGDNLDISIYDIRGRLVEKIKPNNNSIPILIQLQNQHESGVYLLKVASDNGKFITKLILK